MLSEIEVKKLIADMESDWIERTISIREDNSADNLCISNDFPNHKHSGFI
jgi:ATP-dependent DNA helicase RecG